MRNSFDDQMTIELAYIEYERYIADYKDNAEFDSPPPKKRVKWIAEHYPHLLRLKAVWSAVQVDDRLDDIFAKTDFRSAFFDLGYEPSDSDDMWQPTILEKYCKEVSEKLQFPHDTAYLFSLGAVASAMTRQFHYRLNKNDEYTKAPVNLYVVTAQPAGTAKSGIFRNFVAPIQLAYQAVNEGQRKIRSKLIAKLELIKKDIKQAGNEDQKNQMLSEMAELEEAILNTPVYTYAVDDATAEGLRDMAARQLGFFNMVSEEADLVKILMGTVYGDGSRKQNNSMFLKAWDGDIVSVVRAGQDVMTTNVKATLAVIAQDEAIRAIMQGGMSGQGVNERVLLHREKDMLDTVNYRKRRNSTINSTMRADYQFLISSLVQADPSKDICEFYLSDAANEALILYMEHMQLKGQHNKIYRDPAIMGVVSKGEKQICKIASVLHGCQIYSRGGMKTAEIPEPTVRRAIGLFDMLIGAYIKQAETNGYAGDKPRIERVKDYINKQVAQKRWNCTVEQIRDAVKSHESFARCDSIARVVRHEVIPEMERCHMVATDGKRVYFNPLEFM